MNRTERSLRATFLGIGVNVVLAAGKLAGGVFGHSHALIADAMESLTDILSSIIVWRAVVLAAEPADRDHPYGHGKAEAIAAAVVSTMLLLAALGIAINAGRQLFGPREPPGLHALHLDRGGRGERAGVPLRLASGEDGGERGGGGGRLASSLGRDHLAGGGHRDQRLPAGRAALGLCR